MAENQTVRTGEAGNEAAPKKSKLREWMEMIFWAILLALVIRAVFIQAYKIPTGSMQPTLLGADDFKVGDHLLVNKFIYGSTIPFTTTRFLPTIRKPLRGDVIVFFYPKYQPRTLWQYFTRLEYVKRCISVPGETIQVRGKDVLIDGKLLDEPWLRRFPRSMHFSDEANVTEPVRDDLGPLVLPRKGDVVRLSNNFIIVAGKAVPNRSVETRYPTTGNVPYVSGNANYFTEYYLPVLKQTGEGTYVAKSDCYWGMGDNRDNSSDSRYWGFIEFKYLEGVAVLVYWPPFNNNFNQSRFRLRIIH
jgi:signal peptidase I